MMSVSDWDDDYAKLARAASQLRTTTGGVGGNGIDKRLPMGSREEQADAVRQGLGMLLTRLSTLEAQRTLAPAEVGRRRNLVTHLQGQLSGGGGGGASGDGGAWDYQQQEPSSDRPMSAAAMQLRQQDGMLDELEKGVGRLKDSAGLIHDEAQHHVRLIDDMDTNVERAQAQMEAETLRAQKLRNERGSLWRYYATIAVEVVLLVVLLFIGAQSLIIILMVALLIGVLVAIVVGWDSLCQFKVPWGAKRAAAAALK